MLSKFLRFNRRQLHTIISREIMKPSSPTPSQSKTYNLSLLDQTSLNSHTPIVAFYPNLDHSSDCKMKTLELKNSLAKTLTQYYPFAGRVKKTDPTYVDCNDEGVEYIEASNDNSLSDFLQRSEHEDLDPLFPNDLIWFDPYIRGDTEGVTCPLKRIDDCYVYSSLCRFPAYNIDFGWGKPVKVTVGGTVKNLTVLMAAPDVDGIEAIVWRKKT